MIDSTRPAGQDSHALAGDADDARARIGSVREGVASFVADFDATEQGMETVSAELEAIRSTTHEMTDRVARITALSDAVQVTHISVAKPSGCTPRVLHTLPPDSSTSLNTR